MFAGAKTRFAFLLPILDPADVAGRIVKAIEKDRRRLIMPLFSHVTFPARLLPVGAFDFLADFFGISRSMEDFRGSGVDA
jgi:all-trans-retinol dehydrogenase (NAD+)